MFTARSPCLSPFSTRTGACDDCEDHAMASDDDIRQPQTVSSSLTNYLNMTSPRSRTRTRRAPPREEQERTTRPPIDDRGVNFEEGYDSPAMAAFDRGVMDTYRVRVERPVSDAPARPVSDAIRALGGALVSVDLREIDGEHLDDEVVVAVPDDVERRALQAVLEHGAHVNVLSSRTCTSEDATRRAERVTVPVLDGASNDQALADHLCSVCPLTSTWVGPVE